MVDSAALILSTSDPITILIPFNYENAANLMALPVSYQNTKPGKYQADWCISG